MRASLIASSIGVLLGLSVAPALATPPGTGGLTAFEEDGRILIIPPASSWARGTVIADGLAPEWSPDGLSIAYLSSDLGDLWMMNSDGTGKTRLTRHGGVVGAPAWSPDGSRIAYGTQYRSGEDSTRINVLTLGQSDPVGVSPNGMYCDSPSWSPGGDQIAFSCPNELFTPSRSGVWVVQGDGQSPRQLTFPFAVAPHPSQMARHTDVDWAPDGSRILFTSTETGLMAMRPDGTGAAPMGSSFPAGARWEPEGTGLLGVSGPQIRSYSLSPSFAGGEVYISTGGDMREPSRQPIAPSPVVNAVAGVPPAGASGATITVDGRGFMLRSVVRWNGVPRPTTFVNSGRLVATLTAAEVSGAGPAMVSVHTSPAGGGLSPGFSVAVGAAPAAPVAARPALRLGRTQPRVTWNRSRARGTLTVSGTADRAGSITVTVARGATPVATGRTKVAGGPFSMRLRLPVTTLPGKHTVTAREVSPPAGGTAMTPATGELTIAAPAEGVARIAGISTTGPDGPLALRAPRARAAYARFVLASLPRIPGAVRTQWFRDGRFVEGSRIVRPRRARVEALLRTTTAVPTGRWTCVLTVGGRTIAVARIRIG